MSSRQPRPRAAGVQRPTTRGGTLQTRTEDRRAEPGSQAAGEESREDCRERIAEELDSPEGRKERDELRRELHAAGLIGRP